MSEYEVRVVDDEPDAGWVKKVTSDATSCVQSWNLYGVLHDTLFVYGVMSLAQRRRFRAELLRGMGEQDARYSAENGEDKPK